MHKINVLSFGSQEFNTSLDELKDFLNFKLSFDLHAPKSELTDNYDIILIHEDLLQNKNFVEKTLKSIKKIKVIVNETGKKNLDLFQDKLSLPVTIKDINDLIENLVIKKSFYKNSSIEIKGYKLDKNEKRLKKNDDFIYLTEKEIQLLELLLIEKTAINKEKILKEVWKYSNDADTHTVETHIYRLRKKIKSKFFDENFILNNKNGYLI